MDPSRHSGKQTSTRRRFRLSDFAASYWQKNTEATGNDVTSALSATPSLTSLPSAELEQLTVSDRAACLTCALQFATFHEQRIHFKTDWHKYNAQRKVHGRPTITEDDFDGLSDLGSVGSLSGSEAGSDDDEPGANHVLPQPAVQHAEKLEFRHPSGDGTFIVLYKASLPDSATLPSLGERGAWGVVMTGGGHFCAAMWDVKGEMIRHKTFHRYTSRRKQGGSQAAADKSRGGGRYVFVFFCSYS